MKRAFCFVFISFLGAAACLFVGQAARLSSITWDDCLKQTPEWYRSEDATRIADNVLSYQRSVGGWPKNIDMAVVLSETDQSALAKQRQEEDATIDNGATYTQLVFLARVYNAQRIERHKTAFLQGLDYLFRAQYANGGWPQYYPLKKGYYSHITYNDNAMSGVMKLLRDVAKPKTGYAFVDEAGRLKAEQAVQKGIECFLKTQVMVKGKLTVWCAQHDEITLAPAPARKFEPVSLSGLESVGIVRFLMGIERPTEPVLKSIEAAITWFEKTQISDVRWIEKTDPTKIHGFDHLLIRDTGAGSLWARFYELGTDRPIFLGRDSIVRYDVAEIEDERRNGYQWYVKTPAELLQRDCPAWRKRLGR